MRLPEPARATGGWAVGDDVTYTLGRYPTLSEYGYTDQPGRWDHWPAAFVFTGGTDGTAVAIVVWFVAVLPVTVTVAVLGHAVIVRAERWIAWLTSVMTVIFIALLPIPGILLVADDPALGSAAAADPVRALTALVSLLTATVIGLGMVTSSDPNIAKAVGFLLTDDRKKGLIGTTNIGVLVTMGVGAALYASLTFALRIDPGREHPPGTYPATGGGRAQIEAAHGDGSTRTTT